MLARFATSSLPNVISAIDCTHISVRALSENEFGYVNRKHVNSINVQVVCEYTNMVLTNVLTQWPGSTQDSIILVHSSGGKRVQAGVVCDGGRLGKLLISIMYKKGTDGQLQFKYNLQVAVMTPLGAGSSLQFQTHRV